MTPTKKRSLDQINEHLTCHLCSGYLIDAWTINECLHSFCRACIFSYFNDNDENNTCPRCSTVPHPGNPLLGITKDCWLQQLVYKLVPSLFKREMCQRRIFYDTHPESKAIFIEQYSKTHSSQMGCREEELGELSERCLFQQRNSLHNQEKIYITLEYNEQESKLHEKQFYFLECSSHMPIKILKQYLRKVLPLSKRTQYQIEILFDQKVLLDNFTLNHVYSWKINQQDKQKQLHLFYRVIIIERDTEQSMDMKSPIKTEEPDTQEVTSSIVNLGNTCENQTNIVASKAPAFIRSSNVSNNPSSFVHTTPFTPAEARTISLNHSIMEQIPSNEAIELIKPKECTLIDCKTIAMTVPISYSADSIDDISKVKKRPKKSNTNEQLSTKKCKVERKKKIKEEKSVPVLPVPNNPPLPSNKSTSENENPNEQKLLSYSEVVQEANKLLAAEEPLTPNNNPSSSIIPLTNPATARLTKPIATVSPLHTSKNSNNRVQDNSNDELIDLSKSSITANVPIDDVPVKSEMKKLEEPNCQLTTERKKRVRQISSSTTRTKVSRHSNKSTANDEPVESSKTLKKTLSNMNSHPYIPPPVLPTQQHQQQQMFQNFFHSFQNQANYWPMSPWPVPPSLALMADPRNYYPQAWSPAPHPPTQASMQAPKDLSSVSLNDFIGDPTNASSNPHFPLPPSAGLMNSASNFSRTPSSGSLHLHHPTSSNRHRPTPLNGTLS